MSRSCAHLMGRLQLLPVAVLKLRLRFARPHVTFIYSLGQEVARAEMNVTCSTVQREGSRCLTKKYPSLDQLVKRAAQKLASRKRSLFQAIFRLHRRSPSTRFGAGPSVCQLRS
ncbi:hypothetical protein L1887_58585 [Cichorium endivia]|nr:hypothetical protein L1887_58585 [Cichorium endivia]